jgi:hypothetical protein
MPSTSESLVTLKGGFVVPVAVVAWLINAEDRGLIFVIHHDRLRVSPADAVRAEDDQFIRAHKDLLKRCVTYIDQMAEAPL